MGCRILLGNTYHLANQPGTPVLDLFGGLHPFMDWDRNILTDSGGFQMVSLLKLSKMTEEGVEFASPVDGSKMLLTPEESMRVQNAIGGDIMMALDDVVSPDTPTERIHEACYRTVRWLDRCLAAHQRKDKQNLFAIVQGGLDDELRDHCLSELLARDLPGYAIGGLSGGEEKVKVTQDKFWRVVAQCTERLPADKPRYLMGVGYPVDLVVCACLGVDMFDCVFASRTARFGQALTKNGFLRIKREHHFGDLTPIQDDCRCPVVLTQTCQRYSKSYLSTVVCKEETACHLLTLHNFYYLLDLMTGLRQAILEDRLPAYVK